MLDAGKYSKDNEKLVLLLRDMLILEALRTGKNVIVDDTNLNPQHEKDIRTLVKTHISRPIQFIVKTFDTHMDECIERDLKRAKSVGADVIIQMAKRWLKPYKVCIPELNHSEIITSNKPLCIIYDLDGTAAIMGDRSPYDASKCYEIDRPNYALLSVLLCMTYAEKPFTFIALSGRSSKYRDTTVRFLDTYGFPYSALFMRQDEDSRKDAVVKKELYEKHIQGKYNVLVVFDDRDQVVDMWRKELNVPCFQVNYGDF
jgi:predicted kinase